MADRLFTQSFGVVGAILERDGKFLLVREGPQSQDKGKWNQPAGWIDVGDDPLDAVRKEVTEETGYDFTPTGLLGVYSLVRRDLIGQRGPGGLPHAIKLVFLGKFSGEPISSSDEISEIKWFTPEEIFAMQPGTLRDIDIKQEVRDYLAGKSYPLDIIRHTISE